jgi:hypothetical protein
MSGKCPAGFWAQMPEARTDPHLKLIEGSDHYDEVVLIRVDHTGTGKIDDPLKIKPVEPLVNRETQ